MRYSPPAGTRSKQMLQRPPPCTWHRLQGITDSPVLSSATRALTVAFAGGLLNIKPVITVVDGEIQVIGKARGSKQGNNLLVQKIHESGGIDFDEPIILGYSGLSDSYLKKYVEDSRDIWQGKADSLDSTLICSVIGTHTGPGVVAVAFFKKG